MTFTKPQMNKVHIYSEGTWYYNLSPEMADRILEEHMRRVKHQVRRAALIGPVDECWDGLEPEPIFPREE